MTIISIPLKRCLVLVPTQKTFQRKKYHNKDESSFPVVVFVISILSFTCCLHIFFVNSLLFLPLAIQQLLFEQETSLLKDRFFQQAKRSRNTTMAAGMGFNYRAVAILQVLFVMIPRFYNGCYALLAPSDISVRMQQRVFTKALSMTSSVDGTSIDAELLEPKAVSSKVFSSDQRPVILFDGGTLFHFSIT